MHKSFMNFFIKTRLKKGFSLIELSVIISVAATVAVGFLTWTKPPVIDDSVKAIDTRNKMTEIANAIDIFRVREGRLPCPANPNIRNDGTLKSGASNTNGSAFGGEDLDKNDPNGSDTTAGIDCPTTVGLVPISALELDESYMNDEWGRRFTYRVSSNLCGSGVSQAIGCTTRDYETKTGNITVTDGTNTITTQAAYVLVSHGANGYGAKLPSGESVPPTGASANEQKNYDTSATATYVKANISSTFDDIVLMRTRNQIENETKQNSNNKLISVADCEANSQNLKGFVLSEMTGTTSLRTQLTQYQQGALNTGDQVALGVMKAIQTVCVSYYGYVGGVVSGWSGAQCPGNNNPASNGSSYYAPTDSCSCKSGLWDGNCRLDSSTIAAANLPGAGTNAGNVMIWMDADDASTITHISGEVNQWKDKSGRGYNVIQTVATSQPNNITYNNRNWLQFDGNDYLSINANAMDFTNGITAVAVVSNVDYSINSGKYRGIFGKTSAVSSGQHFIMSITNLDKFYTTLWDSSNVAVSKVSGIAGVTSSILVGLCSNSSPHSYLYDKGVLVTVDTIMNNNIIRPTASSDEFTIGIVRPNVSSPGIGGYIGEVLIYNYSISKTDRIDLENYLSAKWGIAVTH